MSIVDNLTPFRILISFLLLFTTYNANADWQHDISNFFCERWQTISSIEQECKVSFPGLSQHYQLPRCETPLQFKNSRQLSPGRNGVAIQCAQPSWQQNLAFHLHVYAKVVVLANPVRLGDKLEPADLNLVRYDLSNISGHYFNSLEEAVGQVLRRPVRTGTVLTPTMLESPQLINRGDLLTIRVQRAQVSIEVQGTALERGKLGETIRVRNNQSNNIVAGRVIADGIVVVE